MPRFLRVKRQLLIGPGWGDGYSYFLVFFIICTTIYSKQLTKGFNYVDSHRSRSTFNFIRHRRL